VVVLENEKKTATMRGCFVEENPLGDQQMGLAEGGRDLVESKGCYGDPFT
jgi:hypothetical protein